MTKEFINGIEYQNYSTNNYSCNMEAVIFNPKDISPKEILSLPGFWLHPTEKPNSLEISALKGSAENFKVFLCRAIDTYCTQVAVNEYGYSFLDETINMYRQEKIDQLINNFTPWYARL